MVTSGKKRLSTSQAAHVLFGSFRDAADGSPRHNVGLLMMELPMSQAGACK